MKSLTRLLAISAIPVALHCYPAVEKPEPKHSSAHAGAKLLHALIAPKQVRLLIVPDGFTTSATDMQAFNDEVTRVLAGFALLPGITVNQLVSQPAINNSAMTGVSTLGLTYLGNGSAAQAQCYFKGRAQAILTVGSLEPTFSATHYIVIFAKAGGIGCADGTTMFINANTPATTIAHEMGHAIIGLYDERGMAPNAPQISWRNCTDDPTNPNFGLALGAPVAGCDGYHDLFRPTANTCRMRNQNNMAFCDVCTTIIGDVMSGPITAPPPGLSPGALDVTAILNANGTIRVLNAIPARPERLLPEVITGETFAVARDVSDVVGVTPMAIDDGFRVLNEPKDLGHTLDLRARSYPPYGQGDEINVPVDSRLIHVILKGVTLETVLKPGYKLSLDVLNLGNARSRLYVDRATITNLKGLPFHGIDFANAIRNQLNLH